MYKRLLAFTTTVVGVGCVAPTESNTEMDGIYSVDRWTTSAPCEGEAASIEEEHPPLFWVKYETLLDYAAVSVRTCADLVDCQTQYADDNTLHLGRYVFHDRDENAWSELEVSARAENDICVGRVYRHRLEREGADRVRLETRGRGYFEFAGQCTNEAALAVDATLPCAELEVRVGVLVDK